MKLLISLFLLCTFLSSAQELSKNPDNNIYEFTDVISKTTTVDEVLVKLRELKYEVIEVGDTFINAENSFSHLVMGNFPVVIKYNLNFEFKEDRFRFRINRFILQDKNAVPVPLKDMKSHTKKWIKKINEKLPELVKALEIKESSKW